MYREQRPTCVTVIGWAWIVIGILMCISAVMAVLISSMMMDVLRDQPDVPFIIELFPLLFAVQLVVGVLGIFAGVHFLRLRTWARTTLEVLSWSLLVLLVGFLVLWMINWLSMAARHGGDGFALMGAVVGLLSTALYVVPLGIMLRYLRGPKVREAMQ